jgi:hypothetical protein
MLHKQHDNLLKTKQVENAVRGIFEQLNRTLAEKSRTSRAIDHNLEMGLANEQALRDVLIAYLPRKYGVTKGKVVNKNGQLSRHCDVIIYDALNCPSLYLDDNRNQILPIDGVYMVWEVKTSLTRGKLEEAFVNLSSVYNLLGNRPNRSMNDFVEVRPPGPISCCFYL